MTGSGPKADARANVVEAAGLGARGLAAVVLRAVACAAAVT